MTRSIVSRVPTRSKFCIHGDGVSALFSPCGDASMNGAGSSDGTAGAVGLREASGQTTTGEVLPDGMVFAWGSMAWRELLLLIFLFTKLFTVAGGVDPASAVGAALRGMGLAPQISVCLLPGHGGG